MPETFRENEDQKVEAEKGEVLNRLLVRIPSEEEKQNVADIVRRSEFLSMDTEYSNYWQIALDENEGRVDENILGIFKEKLTDKIVVDLGGGKETMRQAIGFSGIYPSLYVNVDKFLFDGDDDLNRKTSQGFPYGVSSLVWQGEKNINHLEVDAEMLGFLQYIEDNSVDAISLNGIDVIIAGGTGYHEELGQQIYRALKAGGILFGVDSRAIELLSRDKDFSAKWESKFNANSGEVQILEKKAKEEK